MKILSLFLDDGKEVDVEKPLDEKKKKSKTDYSKEKESGLHGWFSRQGGKGKSKGWVDCNTCRKDKKTGKKTCKSCGRKKGEKRAVKNVYRAFFFFLYIEPGGRGGMMGAIWECLEPVPKLKNINKCDFCKMLDFFT